MEIRETLKSFDIVSPVLSNTVILELTILGLKKCNDWVIHPSHRPAYMQSVLEESTSFMPISESYFIPLTEDSILAYLNESSKNARNLKDQYDMQESTILGVSKDKQLLYFQEGNTILATYLEDYLTKELDRYLANL